MLLYLTFYVEKTPVGGIVLSFDEERKEYLIKVSNEIRFIKKEENPETLDNEIDLGEPTNIWSCPAIALSNLNKGKKQQH